MRISTHTIHRNDHVADSQSGLGRGAAIHHIHDLDDTLDQ